MSESGSRVAKLRKTGHATKEGDREPCGAMKMARSFKE